MTENAKFMIHDFKHTISKVAKKLSQIGMSMFIIWGAKKVLSKVVKRINLLREVSGIEDPLARDERWDFRRADDFIDRIHGITADPTV